MSNLFCFTAGTMIGSLVAFFVFSIFYVGRRREKERECEEDRLVGAGAGGKGVNVR